MKGRVYYVAVARTAWQINSVAQNGDVTQERNHKEIIQKLKKMTLAALYVSEV